MKAELPFRSNEIYAIWKVHLRGFPVPADFWVCICWIQGTCKRGPLVIFSAQNLIFQFWLKRMELAIFKGRGSWFCQNGKMGWGNTERYGKVWNGKDDKDLKHCCTRGHLTMQWFNDCVQLPLEEVLSKSHTESWHWSDNWLIYVFECLCISVYICRCLKWSRLCTNLSELELLAEVVGRLFILPVPGTRHR